MVGREVQKTTKEVKTNSHGPNPKLPPPPEHTAAYMDDVYVWGENPLHVQHLISRLEANLARHGLKINRKKTCVISNEGKHTFYIAGHQIAAQGPDCPLMVLGSPVAFAGGPALVNAEMSTRARKAFYANKKMFLARTGLKTRLQAHNMVVREAGLWGSPTWPVNDSTLRAANGIQLHHTRDMMQVGRKPGESWVEWNTRSLRLARIILVKYKIPRWSTRILEATWNLWGHVGRAEDPTTRNLVTWRGMAWWEQEKAKPDKVGARHAGRFNPNLDTERHISNTAGTTSWWKVAADRALWNTKRQHFVDRHDVPWSSGKQTALPNVPNLAPNSGASRQGEELQMIASQEARETAAPTLAPCSPPTPLPPPAPLTRENRVQRGTHPTYNTPQTLLLRLLVFTCAYSRSVYRHLCSEISHACHVFLQCFSVQVTPAPLAAPGSRAEDPRQETSYPQTPPPCAPWSHFFSCCGWATAPHMGAPRRARRAYRDDRDDLRRHSTTNNSKLPQRKPSCRPKRRSPQRSTPLPREWQRAGTLPLQQLQLQRLRR